MMLNPCDIISGITNSNETISQSDCEAFADGTLKEVSLLIGEPISNQFRVWLWV